MPDPTARPNPALAAVRDLGIDVGIDDAPTPGWVRLDELAARPTLLATGLELAGERFGVSRAPRTAAPWLVADVTVPVAWALAAALLVRSPMRVAGPRAVHLPHPGTGRRLALRLASACTTADVPDPGLVAQDLTATLAPLVDTLHATTRRGRRALWGTVTDMVTAAFHRVGDHLDRPSAARHAADDVVAASPQLVGGTNWCAVPWSGGIEHTRVRNVCCLWYRAPGGTDCVTCPRLDATGRRRAVERRAQTSLT